MPSTVETKRTTLKAAAKHLFTSERPPELSSATVSLAAQERERMIAEAAYYRALERNFEGGDALTDWLAAEQEIDQRLEEQTAAQS